MIWSSENVNILLFHGDNTFNFKEQRGKVWLLRLKRRGHGERGCRHGVERVWGLWPPAASWSLGISCSPGKEQKGVKAELKKLSFS